MAEVRRVLGALRAIAWEILRTDEALEAERCACWRAIGVSR